MTKKKMTEKRDSARYEGGTEEYWGDIDGKKDDEWAKLINSGKLKTKSKSLKDLLSIFNSKRVS